VFRFLGQDTALNVQGTARSKSAYTYFTQSQQKAIHIIKDVLDDASLKRLFEDQKPDVVVNCIGLVKQLDDSSDPLVALPINSMLPHKLARMAASYDARLIHVSTDCVFAGTKGNYTEDHPCDATDLYGMSKYIGEVDDPNAITLRTSIIGPELSSATGLVEWFLSQSGQINGFTRAIFSGLPTYELARVIQSHVLPDQSLSGVFHVAADPISKFDLLSLVAKVYGKEIEITEQDQFIIDRSLNGDRFKQATGYVAPDWATLVTQMRDFG